MTFDTTTPLRTLASLLVAAFVLGALPARAVDGVVEINQAAALAGGVTLLDAPGFPVTIAERGSYRLTGELNVPPDTNGIDVGIDHVTIDLNGFTIFGGGGASGVGIHAPFAVQSVRVHDGTVANMAGKGVHLAGSYQVVEDVTAKNNGAIGVDVGYHSVVRRSVAIENDGHGIALAFGGLVDACVASRNAGDGMRVTAGVASRNSVVSNDQYGIYAEASTLVVENAAISNDWAGIRAVSSAVALGGNAMNNNNSGGAEISGSPVQVSGNACAGSLCP